MTRNIVVEGLCGRHIEDTPVEIVERKGIGHPDSISDGVADAVSKALCKYYLKEFDAVFHHNTDETQIVAGEVAAQIRWGRNP